MASNTPAGIQPFQEFLNSVHSADPARTLHGMSDAVANESAVADMRTHVLRYYEGVEAEHSFVDENGSIFDCVPIERQPSLRRSAEPVPTAPDLPTAGSAGREADPRQAEHVEQLHSDRKDRHGNRMYAAAGTIPLRRLTLESLARFGSLQQFMQKSPFGSAVPPMTSPANGSGGTQTVGGTGVDLRGADLRGADLRGAHLRGADLRGAICAAPICAVPTCRVQCWRTGLFSPESGLAAGDETPASPAVAATHPLGARAPGDRAT